MVLGVLSLLPIAVFGVEKGRDLIQRISVEKKSNSRQSKVRTAAVTEEIRREADNGARRWYYQYPPGDVCCGPVEGHWTYAATLSCLEPREVTVRLGGGAPVAGVALVQ